VKEWDLWPAHKINNKLNSCITSGKDARNDAAGETKGAKEELGNEAILDNDQVGEGGLRPSPRGAEAGQFRPHVGHIGEKNIRGIRASQKGGQL